MLVICNRLIYLPRQPLDKDQYDQYEALEALAFSFYTLNCFRNHSENMKHNKVVPIVFIWLKQISQKYASHYLGPKTHAPKSAIDSQYKLKYFYVYF